MKLTNELIIQKEKELLTAMASSNVSELRHLLADDLVFINHEGLVMSKEDDLKAHQSGLLKISKLEATDQKITIFNDTAVVSVSVSLEGSFSGHDFAETFKYGRVWKALETRIQIIFAQCSVIGGN